MEAKHLNLYRPIYTVLLAFALILIMPGLLVSAQMVGNLGIYGNYYGAIFELKVGGTPAALKLLWARENGPWKIIAYSIEIP